jgi:hypothetical protein
MADNTNSNVTQEDVTKWIRNAPVDSLMQVITPALDRISTAGSDYHRRFQSQLSPQAKKLFQGEPVG